MVKYMTEETLSSPLCFRYICDEDIVIQSGKTVNIDGDTAVKIQDLIYPDTDGTSGQALTTDGKGNLGFSTVSGSGDGTAICDADGDTCVEVERTADDDTIRLKANAVDVQTITESTSTIDNDVTITGKMTVDSTATHILNQLHVDGKMEASITITAATAYNVGDTEYMIEWSGTSAGIMTLPLVSSNTGRHLIIMNRSSNDSLLTILPTTGDTLEGRPTNMKLKDKYCHLQVMSDGTDNWMSI